jgi:hypothetical protein
MLEQIMMLFDVELSILYKIDVKNNSYINWYLKC